jgi:hypothetical protein
MRARGPRSQAPPERERRAEQHDRRAQQRWNANVIPGARASGCRSTLPTIKPEQHREDHLADQLCRRGGTLPWA